MARPPGSGRVSSAPSAPTTEEFLEEGSFFFFSFLRVLHFLIDEISQRNKYDSRSRFINQLPSLLLCSLLKHLQVMMDDGSTPLSSRRADPHAEREPGDPHPPCAPTFSPSTFLAVGFRTPTADRARPLRSSSRADELG